MSQPVYAGLSRVRLEVDEFDLGYGVRIRPVYAHLFSHPMIAFDRAPEGKPHPAPWIAATGGGYAHDIEIELSIDGASELPSGHTAEKAIALIASVLRLLSLSLTVPIISDRPIGLESGASPAATFRPFETSLRIVRYADPALETLSVSQLNWIRNKWPIAAKLSKHSRAFETALSACDNCAIEGRTGSAIMLAWGALEGLFTANGRHETTHRLSSYLAAYNHPPGDQRLAAFKRIKKLYEGRSKVAHTAAEGDVGELLEAFVLLRNSMIKILDAGKLPSQDDLDKLVFGAPFVPDRRG